MFQWLLRLFGSGSSDHPLGVAFGPENMIPWPMPLPPGTQALTFRGCGNTTTGKFTLVGDAALRISAEAGPLKLQLQRDDGIFLSESAALPPGAQGLMAVSEGGTYRLVIETPSRWGVTVVARDIQDWPVEPKAANRA